MTLAILSAISPVLPSATIASLLGPLSILALVAVGVAFSALIVGMVAERRHAQAMADMTRTADVVVFPRRPRTDRAAA